MGYLKALKFPIVAMLVCLFVTARVYCEDPQFRFGVAADIQYADRASDGTRYYRKSLGKLQECVNDFNASDLTFTIELGDIIDRDQGSYAPILAIYNQLNMPHYCILGNHEFSGVDGLLSKSFVLSSLGLEKDYYYFVYNGWRFVVVNTGDVSLYSNSGDPVKQALAQSIYQDMLDANSINAKNYNGGIGHVQKAWLNDTLTQASCLGQKVIVFGHHTFFPPKEHCLWNDAEMASLLGAHDCVVAYMNGHNHYGGYATKDGIHYHNFKGMVETETTTAYAIVEVYDDRLKVIGFGREPNKTLPYSVTSLSGPAK